MLCSERFIPQRTLGANSKLGIFEKLFRLTSSRQGLSSLNCGNCSWDFLTFANREKVKKDKNEKSAQFKMQPSIVRMSSIWDDFERVLQELEHSVVIQA